MTAVSSDRQERAVEVAIACRVLDALGHEHGPLGHVGARLAAGDAVVVKPAGLGLREVRASDVVECGIDGDLRTPGGVLHSEMPIHTRIMLARPDVNAVVHTHPPVAAGLLASDAGFAQVNQDSVHFLDHLAWFDDPRLIENDQRGDALAGALGGARAVLIRHHGIVTVGATVAEAVFWAVSLVNSLRIQRMAGSFGNVVEIDPALARGMADRFADGLERRIAGTWHYLVRLAGGMTQVEEHRDQEVDR